MSQTIPVIFIHHHEYASLRDVFALFSERSEETEKGAQLQLLQGRQGTAIEALEGSRAVPTEALEGSGAVPEETSEERRAEASQALPGLTLISSLSRELSKEEMRGQKNGDPVLVETAAIRNGETVSRIEEALSTLDTGCGNVPRSSQTKSFPASTEERSGLEQSALVPPQLARRELKRQLYFILSELSGIRWPWGSLTGIRPTQVAMEELNQAGEREEARKRLVDVWGVSPEKAEKALLCGLEEERILSGLNEDELMVYAGVPFCPGRCSYCSFISRDATRQEAWLGRYADAMIHECETVFRTLRTPVSALYMGGGTPTALPDGDFERVLHSLLCEVPLKEKAEITVEAGRPDTLSEKKLQIMKDCGVHRICINPQSMKDETLVRVGRQHTAEQVRQVFRQARSLGFDEINMDLIHGLPGESDEDFLSSVREVLKLEPDAVTLHTLSLKRSSRLQEEMAEEVLPQRFPDPAFAAAAAKAEQLLAAGGYRAYYLYRQKNVRGGLENTGFARPGKNCIYNVGMMSDRISVVGLGSGSSSKKVRGRRVERLHNSKDLQDYTERVEELAQNKVKFFQN